jgi:hypothetical protein
MEIAFEQIVMSALTNAIFEASYVLTGSMALGRPITKSVMKVSKESLAFIQGTGLDLMIQEYQIDYDASKIRHCFYRRFGIHG